MNLEEFSVKIKQLSKRIGEIKGNIATEEATKMSFVVPFFQILGYDVFDPSEFTPEFIADVGIKKGEKVDYAISLNNTLTILIEAKWCGEKLEKHDSQLYRYFGVTKAKFAILTNGITYRFFTDLDDKNKMDEKPFLEVNMLDLKDSQISELKKFSKEAFDVDTIFTTASDLKYTHSTKNKIIQEFTEPSDAFVKSLINDIYDGLKTQKVVDDFKPIIKKSFNQYVNELINERLKNAISKESQIEEIQEIETTAIPENKIITTEDELNSFYIIKSILSEKSLSNRIVYKDTESYFGILFDNNTRKWICRLYLSDQRKAIIINGYNDNSKNYIEKLDDLYNFKNELFKTVEQFL